MESSTISTPTRMEHLIKDWRRKGWIGGVKNQTMSWTGPKTLHEVIRQM